MENNGNGNYGHDDSNPQNEKEKHIDMARLNVDSERKTEDFKSDTDPYRYYNNDNTSNNEHDENNFSEGPAETSGKESAYRSPEDERAFNTKNTEKYITQDNPDNREAQDT
ncbi:hypothetical protein [Flavobacterium sp.]|uniref:hypothetical protein n=1 Tax=Flavobacterium sp. TaxID=239 RepID=UPI0025E9D0FA|nr:hypothetical protein [Flavobacterium sp.]